MVNRWLRAVDNVLAFHSAQAKDGGSGAVYVLLKKIAPNPDSS
jgi:DNA-nicking Smr family endonuclease